MLPVTRSIPFKEFIKEVQQLLRKHPTLKFTEGWCFGDPASISLESGIDTLVGGGDNNYHHTDGLTPDSIIKISNIARFANKSLTPGGFRVTNDWQFVWIKPAPAAKSLTTLSALAKCRKPIKSI